ncbi:arabinose ABC transporter permease [Pseudomonas sp. LB-090624]|uniref:MFS transporter n=1 Tax=Pseudomonas sp. LB-090624 TaxID=2213079 RepID=UPI000D88FB93|nr:MFS transporter [Pseudomonas sp. LB-090624]PYB78866.1 arabinose ABC transporter permease [Pseudomonas sp. LB-090624]
MSSNIDIHFAASPLQKASALFIPCFAYVAILGIPITFTGIIETFGIDPAQATIASTAEIACIAFASICMSFVLGLMNRKTLYVLGILMAFAGQVGTLVSGDFSQAVVYRGLAGLGEGLCIGLGFASLAQFKGGTKLLGYSSAISAGVTLSAFMLVPALHEVLGNKAVFWALAIGYAVLLPLAFALPNVAKIQHIELPKPSSSIGLRSISLFALCLLSSIGANTLWLYFEQVGQQAGLDFAGVGMVGSVGMFCSMFVPFLANKAFAKFKNALPLVATCLLMAITSYLYVKPHLYIYWSVGLSMTFLYVFLLAYARMYSSEIDSTGRTTAAASGADSLGMVIGPMVVAVTLQFENGYGQLGDFGVLMQLLCIVPAAVILAKKTRAAPLHP